MFFFRQHEVMACAATQLEGVLGHLVGLRVTFHRLWGFGHQRGSVWCLQSNRYGTKEI